MRNGEEKKVEGQIDKLKGEAKDKYGKVTDDKGKQLSGKMDKAKGEVKKQMGKVKDKMEDNNRKQ